MGKSEIIVFNEIGIRYSYKPFGMHKVFQYEKLYLPTMTRFNQKIYILDGTEEKMLKLINHWNTLYPNYWVYFY